MSLYEDGSRRSNRKVPRALTGGIDGDKPAHGFLIEQDREIAEKSGKPPLAIKASCARERRPRSAITPDAGTAVVRVAGFREAALASLPSPQSPSVQFL